MINYGLFFILAFFCEFIDTSIGGGYGTILTPVAIAFGINPLVIIPAILFSEICTGFVGGFAHHYFGNVNWKIVMVDGTLGLIGILLGVFVGVSISPTIMKLWIGIIILSCGILLILSLNKIYLVKHFKLKNDIPLTLLCSFNKGLSGGGYGPVSTAGLIIVKADPKKAVGSTIFSEGIVCLIGFIVYVLLGKASLMLNPLTITITVGALLATLPAAYISNRLPREVLVKVISVFMMVLGVYTLLKVFI